MLVVLVLVLVLPEEAGGRGGIVASFCGAVVDWNVVVVDVVAPGAERAGVVVVAAAAVVAGGIGTVLAFATVAGAVDVLGLREA